MKTLKGKVVSNKMQKSAVVLVERLWMHPVYKKSLKRSKRYIVEAPEKINLGAEVVIAETKPVSKKKRWKIIEILK